VASTRVGHESTNMAWAIHAAELDRLVRAPISIRMCSDTMRCRLEREESSAELEFQIRQQNKLITRAGDRVAAEYVGFKRNPPCPLTSCFGGVAPLHATHSGFNSMPRARAPRLRRRYHRAGGLHKEKKEAEIDYVILGVTFACPASCRPVPAARVPPRLLP